MTSKICDPSWPQAKNVFRVRAEAKGKRPAIPNWNQSGGYHNQSPKISKLSFFFAALFGKKIRLHSILDSQRGFWIFLPIIVVEISIVEKWGRKWYLCKECSEIEPSFKLLFAGTSISMLRSARLGVMIGMETAKEARRYREKRTRWKKKLWVIFLPFRGHHLRNEWHPRKRGLGNGKVSAAEISEAMARENVWNPVLRVRVTNLLRSSYPPFTTTAIFES